MVGVGYLGGHCGVCANCRRGDFVYCANQPVTGDAVDGGYAEYAIARASGLVAVPEELSAAEGAPLLCAGITVFNGLRKGAAQAGDLVAVQGIGGLGLRGRLIVVGAANDPIEGTTGSLIFGGRSIHGSLTGTPSENEENLAFSLANDVRPLVEVVPLEEAGTAYERMMSGAARFRMVLTTTQEG